MSQPPPKGFLHSVNRMFERAAATLTLRPGFAELMENCRGVYQVRFPVEIRDEVRIFTGWRAVHSEHRLPTKGGIRSDDT